METYAIILIAIAATLGFVLLIWFASGLGFCIGVLHRKKYSLLGGVKHRSAQRLELVNPLRAKAITELENDYTYQTLEINADDGIKLSARLYSTSAPSAKGLVFCLHGFNSNPMRVYAPLVPFLLEQGYDALLVSARAHGDSGGKWSGFSCLDGEDVRAWLLPLSAKYQNIMLFGVSMGAAACAVAAGDVLPKEVKGVIFDCGFTSPKDEFVYSTKRFTNGKLTMMPVIAAGDLWCRVLAGYSFCKCSALDSVTRAKVPFLFIQGADDARVPVEMHKRMYDACASEKYAEVFDGAEHMASMFVDMPRYERAIGSFIERCFQK